MGTLLWMGLQGLSEIKYLWKYTGVRGAYMGHIGSLVQLLLISEERFSLSSVLVIILVSFSWHFRLNHGNYGTFNF